MTAPPGDLYESWLELGAAEQRALLALRRVLGDVVRPVLDDHWERGAFPDAVVAPLASLDLMNPELDGPLYEGFRTFELARVDASIATFYNGQSGLFRTIVERGGSPDQIATLLPSIRSFALPGAFALTEPGHGSDIARGIRTEAAREGSSWILTGRKRWIGSADRAGRIAVVARTHDGVGCFLIDPSAPGVSLRRIERKTSLRIMQNFDIELERVRVPEDQRLERITSFGDVADCLRAMRAGVAWIATGAAAGAYEAALAFALEREQFGRPIAGFQLVQERLATMLGNVTAMLSLVVRLSQRQASGILRDEDSALAKAWTSARLREVVAAARETCGGDGITLDAAVARFHADAEAIYSYEGTHDINSLIVGRAITGLSAFAR